MSIYRNGETRTGWGDYDYFGRAEYGMLLEEERGEGEVGVRGWSYYAVRDLEYLYSLGATYVQLHKYLFVTIGLDPVE